MRLPYVIDNQTSRLADVLNDLLAEHGIQKTDRDVSAEHEEPRVRHVLRECSVFSIRRQRVTSVFHPLLFKMASRVSGFRS